LLGVGGLAVIGVGIWQLMESGVFGGSSSSSASNSGYTAPALDPLSTTWQVSFVADGLAYEGQFEPIQGNGKLKILYNHPQEGPVRVVQDCSMIGTQSFQVTCRNPRVLSGNVNYVSDNFQLSRFNDNELRGTFSSSNTTAPGAVFRKGSHPRYAEAIWNSAGVPAEAQSSATPAPATGSAGGGDLAAQLSAAADIQRRQLRPGRAGLRAANVEALPAIFQIDRFPPAGVEPRDA
jgi:hypothetical protein